MMLTKMLPVSFYLPVRLDNAHAPEAAEDIDEDVVDQPSILVAAAMSSQQQGASFQELMAQGYRRASGEDNQSFNNTDTALAPTDADLSEYYDEASQDGTNANESNVEVVAQHHGRDLELGSVLDAHVEVVDSGDESRFEGGQLTDDGYQPDAEVSEVEKSERKKPRAVEDGYGKLGDSHCFLGLVWMHH